MDEEQENAFEQPEATLTSLTSLSYPKKSHSPSLFTDASEDHWSTLLALFEEEYIDKPPDERACEPLGSLAFFPEQHRSLVSSREGRTVHSRVDDQARLHEFWMTHSQFTDRMNFLSVYDPNCVSNDITRYAANKVMGWAIHLSSFKNIVEHIPRHVKYGAYILSRWTNRE